MAPPVPVSANRGDAQRPREPSTIYRLIMTPLIFVSFLVSLCLVDLRYSALRARYHPDPNQPSRLPRWLHRIVYRYRPYRYVVVDEQGRPAQEAQGGGAESPRSPDSPESPGSAAEADDYYRSKQRKLMRMEVEEAFEIRGVVMVVIGLVGLGISWAIWSALIWILMKIYYGC